MKRTISRVHKATERQTCADHLKGGLLFPVLVACGASSCITDALSCDATTALGIGAVLTMLGVVAVAGESNVIKVGTLRDSVGRPKGFTLNLGGEIVVLHPGIPWAQVDKFKWGARGLVDEPNLFRVLPNGSVEINGETISLGDPSGPDRLQHEINKRHAVSVSQIAPASVSSTQVTEAVQSPGVGRVHFKVRLDRFGHVVIEYVIAGEREETGLRGIPTLIANDLMARPDKLHLDPMQRAVEIDGVRYECTEEGVHRLEEALNSRYAARPKDDKGIAIEVKENVVSVTGFDIRFMTIRAGMPIELKDHLSQETLDILTDSSKCEILQPDVQIRLAPPYLLIRRRRPDMGEDKIPGLPDINYLQVSATQLQQILNHPLIRKGGGEDTQEIPQTTVECPTNVVELRVVRHPTNKGQLWLQCVTPDGKTGEGKALTRHNIADIQHHGLFLPHLDVCLSLDNQKLSILDKKTNHEEGITVDVSSPDEVLVEAGRMLTKALRPIQPSSLQPRSEIKSVEPMEVPRYETGPVPAKSVKKESPIRRAEPAPAIPTARLETDPAIGALFRETNPARINREIFLRISRHFEVEPMDMHFSLPMVFDDRRFEILSFYEGEIEDLMQLRGEDFCGFYISHINEEKEVLVYACNGAHLEWGPDKCVLQPAQGGEAQEYPTSALLGLARNKDEDLVFVVQRAFKEWVKPFENHFNDLLVHFCVVSDLASAPDDYNLIWPAVSA